MLLKLLFTGLKMREDYLSIIRNYTIKRVSNVFKKDKAFFCSGQNMHTLKEKLVIPGIAFDGATVYPNKIDIKWEEKIYLKNFF